MISSNKQSPPIATAPEVPSSTNMNYYDPRSSAATSNYYSPTVHPTPAHQQQSQQQQVYMSGDMNSVANAAAAAAAAASNSLPPLSHLLPTNNINKLQQQPTRTNNDNAPDYFSPQTPERSETRSSSIGYHSVPTTTSTSTTTNNNIVTATTTTTTTVPSQPHYRKSIDYQRAMCAPPPAPTDNNRRYMAGDDAYYMMPPQPTQHQPGALSHFTPPTAPPIVPSSADMSVYSVPHPYSRSHLHPNYHLPSPPTSVIDNVMLANHHHMMNGGITNNSQKIFSFVPLPGLNQKKRPRRKFHEVERLYQCNYQDCTKSYGTLNHLNAHVSMQRHVG